MLKWATAFLLPPSPVKVHQVKEILVPWIDHDHWSLLVFQYDKVVHLDSTEGRYHEPEGRDAEFVSSISQAWQTLRGVEPYDVPLVRLEVLRQTGNYECGHHTIRKSMLYLKLRAWRFEKREQLMKTALMAHFSPKDTNMEILCLLACEMDPERRT